MNLDNIVDRILQSFSKNLHYVFFMFLLAMIYIANNHMAQKLVTDINHKAKELKELRWDYLTIKSDLMYQSKLTEVLPKANEIGLKELNEPPYKINLKTKDYQRQD
jgi:Bacteriodetes cell division protein (FtsL-like)